MKKSILALSIATGLLIASSINVVAKPFDSRAEQHENIPKHLIKTLRQLDLSSEQKQTLKDILRTTKQNNSVYAADKEKIRQQMQDLMNMPAWDEDMAKSVVQAQTQHTQNIELNQAKARHKIFQLLTPSQQAELEKKAEKRKSKIAEAGMFEEAQDSDRSNKKHNLNVTRMAKYLDLSDAQKSQIETLRSNAKQDMLLSKEQTKEHREAIRSIIRAPNFDESAWRAQQAKFQDTKVSLRLAQIKMKYETLALLDEEQKRKLKKAMRKMKNRNA